MSYDISLKDPVTGETIEIDEPHFMRGGTYAVGGTNLLWLNITYNYADYYYEATDDDPRFAHDEITAYYADGRTGPVVTKYGIRGIYGKTGAESIPMLKDMISRIEGKYKKDGEWVTTEREEEVWLDLDGREIDPFTAVTNGVEHTIENVRKKIYEGDTDDYWKATAVNAVKPLYSLVAMAQMRPDGVWDGD